MLSLLVSALGCAMLRRSGVRMKTLLLFAPLVAMIFRHHSLHLTVLIGTFHFGLSFAREISRRWRRNSLQQSIPLRLEKAVLCMIAGQSFKISLREAAIDEKFLAESGVGGELARDLAEIERKPTKMAEQLRSLRDFWRTRQDFRRRTGQVLLQARTQAAVSIALFVPLCAWNLIESPLEKIFGRLCLASAFFVAGQIWIFKMGERVRWKV